MAQTNIKLTVRVRWWVWPYVAALRLFCMTFNTTPDSAKVCAFIAKRGIVIRAKRVQGKEGRSRWT